MSTRFASASIRFGLLLWCIGAAPVTTTGDEAARPSLTPFKANGVYELGERAGWKVSLPEGQGDGAATYLYTVKKNNAEPIASGELDLSSGTAEIAVTVDEPAMLFAEVSPQGVADPGQTAIAGAAIA